MDFVLNDPSKKFNSGQNTEEGLEDRISNLPESLIHHILSFLLIHEVVRTSVLSTKWKNIWTNVTTLRLDDRFGRIPQPNEDFSVTRKEERIQISYFMKFVEKTLLLCCPLIEEFYLHCSFDYDLSRVQSWISTVLMRNVRKIQICTSMWEPIVLPGCLWNSGSLVELILQMPCIIKDPSSICFPALKLLVLIFVTFSNVDSSRSSEILFSFPVLEELHIILPLWEKVKVVNIDAPNLKIFSLQNRAANPGTSLAAVKLHRSSLEIFCCGGNHFVDYNLPNPSLVINACFGSFIFDIGQMRKMHSLIFTLLRQFSSLKYLKLSYEDIKGITDLQGRLPTMDNVIKLTIATETPALDGTFIALLQSLPVLQTLVMKGGSKRSYEDEMVLEVVPSCLQSHLKLVQITDFGGTNYGLELVKFLLKNAMVLEQISINVDPYHSESEFPAIKEKFLAFPRGSDHVSISVNPWNC